MGSVLPHPLFVLLRSVTFNLMIELSHVGRLVGSRSGQARSSLRSFSQGRSRKQRRAHYPVEKLHTVGGCWEGFTR